MKCFKCGKDVSNVIYPKGSTVYVVISGDDPKGVIGRVMPCCLECLPDIKEDENYIDEEEWYDEMPVVW